MAHVGGVFKMLGPADFKLVPGFENQPRFVGVIEQNKIQQTFFHYCITLSIRINIEVLSYQCLIVLLLQSMF